MKLNLCLLENLSDNFYQWAKSNSYNIYDFSEFFKEYKNIHNYKYFKNNLQKIDEIKNKIISNFNRSIFNSIDIIIFRTNLIIDKFIIDLFPNAKLFIRAGSGYDNIDLKYLYSKKIIGQNTPKANYISAAEHTLCLMLSIIKKIKYFDDFIRNKNWRGNSPFNTELNNKNVLIIGFGWVGREVFKLLLNFNLNLFIYDPYLNEKIKNLYIEYKNVIQKLRINYSKKISNIDKYENEYILENILFPKLEINFIDSYLKLKNILNIIDIVTIHVPLTDETYKFINYDFLENLKEDSILINTSRGEIIDNESLINFLAEEKIKGYATDVFESEPIYDSDLFKFKYNTILTPHIGSYTFEAKERLTREVINVIENFIHNNKILYPFNENFYYSKYFE